MTNSKNPHCLYEMPIIDKYYRKLKKEGFLVLAVNVKQSAEVALAFIAQFGVTFPVPLNPDGKMARRYGVYALPTNFLIDRQGIIREILIGEVFSKEKPRRDLLKNDFTSLKKLPHRDSQSPYSTWLTPIIPQ